MGEYQNHDCCEPKECCCEPKQYCCQPQNCGSDNSIWLIILIVIVLCLFCGGNDNKGGLLGGLF